MAGPSEAIVMGALLLVVVAAACFYFYSRLTYTEKRLGFMESVLMDIKLAMEQEEEMAAAAAAMPAKAYGGSPAAYTPAPMEPEAADTLAAPPSPEEKEQQFYASILKSVEEVAPVQADADGVQGTRLDSLENSVGAMFPGETLASAAPVESAVPAQAGVNYDAMSKKELETLAEKRGVRVPKRAGRAEIISLLRRTETVASSSVKQEESPSVAPGTNVEGSLLASANNTDGEFAVELGQPQDQGNGPVVDAEEVGI
jgi:hypothetical protein